ncbi:MAG: 30S ribosomal protein S18 [Flavobacteriales bacterium Tduv]
MVLDDLTKQTKPGGQSELRYLSPLKLETKPEKKLDYFDKCNIKYIDYKDPAFLIKFLNAQGKILPRRLTGTSLKNQRELAIAVKRARHLALLPFMSDELR